MIGGSSLFPASVAVFEVDIVAALLNNPAGRNFVEKARICSILIKRELFSDLHRVDHFFVADRAFGTASNDPVSDIRALANLRFATGERTVLAKRVWSESTVRAHYV